MFYERVFWLRCSRPTLTEVSRVSEYEGLPRQTGNRCSRKAKSPAMAQLACSLTNGRICSLYLCCTADEKKPPHSCLRSHGSQASTYSFFQSDIDRRYARSTSSFTRHS